MNAVFDAISAWLGLPRETTSRLLVSLAVVTSVWLLRTLVLLASARKAPGAEGRYCWAKATKYAALVVVAGMLVPLWFGGLSGIGTVLGLVAAALTWVLRDFIAGFAAWFTIVGGKRFRMGDRVQVGGTMGDVVDQGLLDFTLLEVAGEPGSEQSTGRTVTLPNHVVLAQPVFNSTRAFPYVWNEVPVRVALESDWEGARRRLLEIGEKVTGHLTDAAARAALASPGEYLIRHGATGPTVYLEVREDAVLLTLRHLTEARARRRTTQAIWEEILRSFSGAPSIRLLGGRADRDAGAPRVKAA